MEGTLQWATIKTVDEVHPPPRSAALWSTSEDSLTLMLARDAIEEDRRQFLLSKGFLVD